MTETLAGLEDVVIATSSICFIDGDKGILRYRGYNVNELAEKSSYEEVSYLLIYGQLPDTSQLAGFQKELRQNRAVSPDLLKILQAIPAKADAMAWLRTGASALATFDPESEDNSEGANLRKTIRLTAQLSTIAAAIERIRRRESPSSPRIPLSITRPITST